MLLRCRVHPSLPVIRWIPVNPPFQQQVPSRHRCFTLWESLRFNLLGNLLITDLFFDKNAQIRNRIMFRHTNQCMTLFLNNWVGHNPPLLMVALTYRETAAYGSCCTIKGENYGNSDKE